MRSRTPLVVLYGTLTLLLWTFSIGCALYYIVVPLFSSINEYEVVVGIGHNPVLPVLSRAETAELLPTPFVGEEQPYLVEGQAKLRRDTMDPVWPKVFFYTSLLYILPLWWSLVLTRRVLRSVLDRQPFAPENSVRLAWMGWITIGLSFLGPVLNYWAGRVVIGQLPGEGMPLTAIFNLDLNYLMGGLGLLVLALVFRHGTDLETERQLTI